MLLYCLSQLPQCLRLVVCRIGHIATEGFLYRNNEFQTLQRIEAQSDDGCIGCQVGQSRTCQGVGVLADGSKSG